MIRTFRYQVPQALYGPALFEYIEPTQNTLIITANRRHADWLRQQLRQQPRSNVQVRTLQAYMLKQMRQQRKFRVASASTRALLVLQAWQQVGGQLFQQHGHHRGALTEIGTALGWISLQRAQWHRPDHGFDWDSELGHTYLRYCDLLDHAGLIGYEDVACNLLDSGCTVAPDTHVIACELQHAHPAQLRVLSKVAQQAAQFTAAAWLESTHHAPELQHVLDWMRTLAEPQLWPHNVSSPTVPLITFQPDALRTPTHVSMFCDAMYDQSWRAGVGTSLDECMAVSQYALTQLARQHTVDIICCDAHQIAPLQQALHDAGVALPPLAPPRHLNPLIRLLQGCLRWHVTTSVEERAALMVAMAQLPFIGATPTEAHAIAGDSQHPRHRDISGWASLLTPDTAIATALQRILQESGSVQWCWQSAQQRVDISDYWVRDCRHWLQQIREMMHLTPFMQMPWQAQIQHILSINTLPTQSEYLEQSTLPLHIHDRRGQQAARDVVIIMGLSESAGPLLAHDWQIVTEDALYRLCRGRGIMPRRSDPAAWRERESRRLAVSVGSHARHVVLSFAYADSQGRAQLPSPFLEMMLGKMVHMNRHGDLIVTSSRIAPLMPPVPPRATQTVVAPPPMIPLREQHMFSATQIQRFLTCPKQFFYERMLALQEREDAETDTRRLDAGSIIHEVCCVALGNGATKDVNLIHEHMNDYVNRLQYVPERSMAALHAAWHGERITLPGGGDYQPTRRWGDQFDPGLKRMSSLHTLERLLTRWAHHEQRRWEERPYLRPGLLEQTVQFHTSQHQVIARIDRIDIGTDVESEIIDYKTGSDKSYKDLVEEFTVSEALQAKNFQIPLYLHGMRTSAWQLTTPAQKMTLMYIREPKESNKKASESNNLLEERTFHVRDGASAIITGSRNKHVGYNIGSSDLPLQIIRHADEVMTRMLSTPYPTKSGRHCAYCAFTTICDDASNEEG